MRKRRNVMEQVFKVISDFNRVRIINMLLKQKWCVTEMSQILGLSISSVSRHLSKLKLVGIINAQQDAQWIHYVINKKFYDENILLFDYIKSVANKDSSLLEDNKKMERYIGSGLTCREICDCPQRVKDILEDN
jgi:ArsR family transcriptional regulator